MQAPAAIIEELAPDDPAARAAVVETLARAFRDAPLNVAVIRGSPERRLRTNRHGMRGLLASARGGATVWTARPDDLTGALIGVAPHCFPLPPPPLALQLRSLVGQGWFTLRRWGAVYQDLLQLHPQEPHWYLAVIGVRPSHQGRGLGSALLGAFLERVDREGMPAYLESDRAENLPFYRRAGFEVATRTETAGIPIWCMWRSPK
ncbi:MAG: GNAT family N-acetyltransferase [Myxococcota bacterium]